VGLFFWSSSFDDQATLVPGKGKQGVLDVTRMQIFLLVLAVCSWSGLAKSSGIRDAPEYYSYSYQSKNGRIIEKSVCREYSGLDWKECRRFAQYQFKEKCWELGYEMKHKNGNTLRRIKKERAFFCDAKGKVTPLGRNMN